MRRPPLRLPLTLADFHPPNVTFNIRRSYTPDSWGAAAQSELDFRTAQCLSIAGGMPILAGRSVLHPRLERFYDSWRIDHSATVVPFDGPTDYSDRLTQIRTSGGRVAFQHVHPVGERPDDEYWVPREVLSRVNDKASLGALVPAEFVPVRCLMETGDFLRAAAHGDLTFQGSRQFLVKGAGAASSGGGRSVAVVHHPSDLQDAVHLLSRSEAIVVEELLDVRENFNLTYATRDDEILYLGASHQLTDPAGKYLGNWFETALKPSPTMIEIGREIMERAITWGYRGIAGFDLVRDALGRVYVIDLNFRINGSTPALLWIDTLRRRTTPSSEALFVRETLRGPADFWESVLCESSRQLDLFLLGIQASRELTLASVVWLGASRAEIEAKRSTYRQHSSVARRAA